MNQNSTFTTPGVTAIIPAYNNVQYVRRSVDSLLNQTLSDITVVVVSDASPDDVWSCLADISDPRLYRLNLSVNRGMYFALEVARRAVNPEYVLIQDSDDSSEPSRAELLLNRISTDNSAACFSAQYWRRLDGDVRLLQTGHLIDEKPLDYFGWVGFHHGLFRNSSLDYIGGYYGGYRIYYDLFVTCMIRMAGKVSYEPTPVYNRFETNNSLTTSVATGHNSPMRLRVHDELSRVYAECLKQWHAGGSISEVASSRLSLRESTDLDNLAGRINAAYFGSSRRQTFYE